MNTEDFIKAKNNESKKRSRQSRKTMRTKLQEWMSRYSTYLPGEGVDEFHQILLHNQRISG